MVTITEAIEFAVRPAGRAARPRQKRVCASDPPPAR
jgi:hypothetical protein